MLKNQTCTYHLPLIHTHCSEFRLVFINAAGTSPSGSNVSRVSTWINDAYVRHHQKQIKISLVINTRHSLVMCLTFAQASLIWQDDSKPRVWNSSARSLFPSFQFVSSSCAGLISWCSSILPIFKLSHFLCSLPFDSQLCSASSGWLSL